MRKYLGVAVGLLVLVGLVFFAFNEVERDKREGKQAAFSPVFPYGAAQVAELSLTHGDGSARFRRGAGGWEKLEGPEEVDLGSVTDVIGAWSRVRVLEVVDEAPRTEDLGRFGLDAPRIVVRAKLADPASSASPGREPALEVGKPSPLQSALYARVDGFPRVVLVTPDVLDLEQGIGRRVLGLAPLVDDDHRADGAKVGGRPVQQQP